MPDTDPERPGTRKHTDKKVHFLVKSYREMKKNFPCGAKRAWGTPPRPPVFTFLLLLSSNSNKFRCVNPPGGPVIITHTNFCPDLKLLRCLLRATRARGRNREKRPKNALKRVFHESHKNHPKSALYELYRGATMASELLLTTRARQPNWTSPTDRAPTPVTAPHQFSLNCTPA